VRSFLLFFIFEAEREERGAKIKNYENPKHRKIGRVQTFKTRLTSE
jgi:hypothetical protein